MSRKRRDPPGWFPDPDPGFTSKSAQDGLHKSLLASVIPDPDPGFTSKSAQDGLHKSLQASVIPLQASVIPDPVDVLDLRPPKEDGPLRPVNMKLGPEDLEIAAELVKRHGTNRTEEVRRALKVYSTLNDATENGSRVLVVGPDGRMREVRLG